MVSEKIVNKDLGQEPWQGGARLDALGVQLSELNQRVRLYASQAWQIPFAYLAATGLTLLQADSSSEPMAIMLITSTFIVFGLAAALAVRNMMVRAREIVDSIKEVESLLLLKESVKYQKPLPFYLMLAAGIAANAIFLLHNLGFM